ncbi:hypothetical protein K492DRAFT_174185 [Lichtheimia hyalospora FSU 10163]|nr:hypothetical protein K492DRAFT_174185 [Lichtheimia hyalospora FSU 10163]
MAIWMVGVDAWYVWLFISILGKLLHGTGSVGCDEKYTSLGRADLESSKGGLC